MPTDVQAKMEDSFSTDFSNVNIHKNDESATQVGALAYTQGNDVYIAPGQYNPSSQKGQELLGHELTHVVQQRQGKVAPTKQGKGMPVNDSPSLEKEADDMGARAAAGKDATTVKGNGSGVQKYDDSEAHYTYDRDNSVTDKKVNDYHNQLNNEMVLGADNSKGNYSQELQVLNANVHAAYDSVLAGFKTQAGAFQEAYLNYKGVIGAVNS